MSVSHEHIYLLGFLSYCSTVSLVSTRCTAYCIAPRSLSVVRACHTKYYTIPARRSKAKSKTSGMLKPPCLALGQKITRYGGCYWLLPLCTELPPRCCGSRVGWYASAFAVSSLSPPPETRRLTAVYCTYTTTTHGVSGRLKQRARMSTCNNPILYICSLSRSLCVVRVWSQKCKPATVHV